MEMQVVPFRRKVTPKAMGGGGRCMLRVMNKTLAPIESEFATVEEAEAYDRWFRTKVGASMADTRQGIPHDRVMAEIDAIIQAAESRPSAKQS
jgi:hypothetical protein